MEPVDNVNLIYAIKSAAWAALRVFEGLIWQEVGQILVARVFLVFNCHVHIPGDLYDVPEILLIIAFQTSDTNLFFAVYPRSDFCDFYPSLIKILNILKCELFLLLIFLKFFFQFLPLLTSLFFVFLLNAPHIELLKFRKLFGINHGMPDIDHMLSCRLNGVELVTAINTMF